MDPNQRRFKLLTQYVLDGIATDQERAELAELSRTQPDWVASVFDQLTMDALLKWQSGIPVPEQRSLAKPAATHSRTAPTRTSSRLRWWAALAATLLVATGLTFWVSGSFNPVIADIVNQKGVTWLDDCTALTAEGTVRSGRLSSSMGEYTLQFRDGSTVRVEGPASLDIKSKMLVQLDSGKATAQVPEGNTGFTITSALVNVVDQGTEFGISVEDGRADVVVFDGKVDVESKSTSKKKPRRLTQGQAIQVNRQGAINRLANIRRDVEGHWWGGEHSDGHPHVIAKVTDNIGGSSEVYACYQTTYRGLQDDALAYSDNPHHQWNGLTEDGIPAFLLGADYVRTFNHYRYMQYFKMTIEFSQPANLYVFADNRIPAPDWLREQFEDTGADIGIDEGPWLDDIPPEYRKLDVNTTAVGAGNSIDNEFSVWKRPCVDGKPITLGDAGEWGTEGGQGRSMYGVAATPLEEEQTTKQVDPAAAPTNSR